MSLQDLKEHYLIKKIEDRTLFNDLCVSSLLNPEIET